jgi:beta-phosphoglucomutase-like phosphatase (HAD superfamily)
VVVIGQNEVTKCGAHPASYLIAAERFEVDPARSVVPDRVKSTSLNSDKGVP